jgi:rhodanese-related sulfurtransferase/biotin operon repressor
MCLVSHRRYKQALYSQFARVGSALASERRLELLDLLAQAPRHVEALAAEAEMSVANASQHLQNLRTAGLVESERNGNRIVYRLAGGSVLRLWLALRHVGESRLADVERIARDYAVLDPSDEHLSRDTVREMLEGGEVVLIDVRPRVEFEHGHLPGARSVPADDLRETLDDLPRDRAIVAYCRGDYCLFADEAVALLRENGFAAMRLDGGWLEWSAEERPVERAGAPEAARGL